MCFQFSLFLYVHVLANIWDTTCTCNNCYIIFNIHVSVQGYFGLVQITTTSDQVSDLRNNFYLPCFISDELMVLEGRLQDTNLWWQSRVN